MNGASKTAAGKAGTTTGKFFKFAQSVVLILFLLAIGGWMGRLLMSFPLPPTEGLLESIAVASALASTLISLSGQLPAQNVLLATVIIGSIGGAIHTLNSFTGMPFGPIIYTHGSGLLLFHALPWFIPFVWVIFVLTSRGVARLILRPWRKLRVYGFWLIGITAALTLILVFGLEPFATRVRHYWLWAPAKLLVDWYGAPLINFLAWLVTTLLILAFATPSLMKKKPSSSLPDYYPVIIWFAMNLLFITGSWSQHLFVATIVSTIACLIVLPLVIRGARW